MSTKFPSVSVVVCAYTEQRWDDIVRAIASVTAQHHRADELLLVIDHNEALAERAAAELTGATVARNAHARGLSGARNTGVEMATGQVIAFLDDDAAAQPDWLERLLAPYRDSSVAAVGGAASPQWPDGPGRPVTLPAGDGVAAGELDWVVGCTYAGQPAARAEVRNVMGCNMSFRRDVFTQVGGFSDGIGRIGSTPLGCEETELCIRVRQRTPDARIVFEPAARVTHRVTEARTGWRYLLRRCWAEGLSKAAISRMVGRDDALSTERIYLTRTLPAAVARQLAIAARGRPRALAGALAIAAAVPVTAAGYLRGRWHRPPQSPGTAPIAVAEVDVLNRPDTLHVGRADGHEYRSARVLLRAGRRTIGIVDLPVRGEEVDLTGLGVPAADPGPDDRDGNTGHQPLVSIVIPTIRPGELPRCVKSVLDSEYPNLEILAVDNRRQAADPDSVKTLTADHRVRYLHDPRPGVSHARNTGLAAARGEYVSVIDDDMVVDHWWLSNAVAELADHRVGCVTGLVLPVRLDTAPEWAFEQVKSFSLGTRRQVFTPVPPREDPARAFVFGQFGPVASSVWRRSALEGIGGFEPLLGVGSPTCGGEDLYALLRLTRSGHSVTYTPHAVTWHAHRADWAGLRRQLRGYGCGLSAMMLLHLWRQPADVLLVARALPGRLSQLARRGRSQGGVPQDRVPRRLLLAELRGIAAGPVALLRSARLATRTGG